MNRKPTPSILDDVLSATPAVAKLSIDQIKIDGGTQMRAGLHEPTVLEYLEAMSPIGWSEFPPIIVYHDGSAYWLADGFHRLEAYRRAAAQVDQPADRIPADVRAGTRRDAILYAAGANAQHGLRRTNADKRRAVETLLRDDEWRLWSDREIGRRCNVSDKTVADVRKSLTAEIRSENERTYTTKHGTTATMQTANIGTKPAIQPGSPEARQLAKEIKAATWGDQPPAKPTYPEPPTRSQISGCVDTLAWEAALGSDEKRLAHMSAPENFSYYLEGVRTRLNFVVNHYSVKDVLAAHIERLRNDLAGAPAEPATPTPVVVDGDRPLPDWAAVIVNPTPGVTDDDDADDTLTAADWQVLKPTPVADDAVIVMTQAEDKTMSLKRLIGVFHHTITEFNIYGELTGHHVETLPAKRELEKLIARLEREIALLNGQPVEAWGEEVAA